MTGSRKTDWLHLTGIVLAALLVIASGWMLLDAWLAFSQPIVIIEWQTASEMNTLGFNIYRSEEQAGKEQIQVNLELIPPASDPLVGGSYAFRDKDVRPGTTYYYWLEELDSEGMSNRFAMDPVTAQRSGWQQGLLGFALLAVAGFVLVSGRRSARTGESAS